MKLIIKLARTIFLLSMFIVATTDNVKADSVSDEIGIDQNTVATSQPTVFEKGETIEQVVNEIDSFYLSQDTSSSALIQPLAAPGTKWGEGTVVWDGKVGHYVTNYFWVKGSNMSTLNVVGKAQRKAVTAKYGSVSANTSYKMKTTQHITQTASQTQEYITISAEAWCYGRD